MNEHIRDEQRRPGPGAPHPVRNAVHPARAPSVFDDPPLEDPELIRRHSTAARLTHTGIAVAYVYLFLSGLALFHPSFYWTAAFLGGGPLMRILHPFVGVALAVLFAAYALTLWRDNRFTAADREWLGKMSAHMMKQHTVLPEAGKYNAGQKLMFWSMIGFIVALVASGLVIWRPYFSPSFSADARQLAGLVHAVSAFVMFVGIGIHVYAAYWTKGAMTAMTRGTVTRAWARFHHPAWYREVSRRSDER